VKAWHIVVRLSLASVALAWLASLAGATTLVRQGLDRLTVESESIVEAKVLDIHSYWNAGHSFILTDVHVRPSRVLKGAPAGDVTFTVLGGSVGDVTTLVVGGADLAPGSDYVLFLAHADLPGAANRLTIRDHSQGVFDVVQGRAFSQAIEEPLLPDARGQVDVVGGAEGVALDDLIGQIRALSNR